MRLGTVPVISVNVRRVGDAHGLRTADPAMFAAVEVVWGEWGGFLGRLPDEARLDEVIAGFMFENPIGEGEPLTTSGT